MIWNFFVSAVPHLDMEFLAFQDRGLGICHGCLETNLGAFACGDGKVVYPVDGYDGETGHAAMLLVMPTKRTGWKAKVCGTLWSQLNLDYRLGLKGSERCYKQEARTRLLDRLPSCCVMLRSRTSTASSTLTSTAAANQRVSGDRRCA